MFGSNGILARKAGKQELCQNKHSFKYQNFNINSLGMNHLLRFFGK